MFVLRQFLTQEERNYFFDALGARQWNFAESTVTTNDPDYRKSKVCFDFNPWQSWFIERIRGYVPAWTRQLRLPEFHIDWIECQLTRTGNGEFFRRHTDTGHPETDSRAFTFVYYFHHMPKLFTGGELLLDAPTGDPIEVEPEDNSIVVFPSTINHEVKETQVPKDIWGYGRFTVNGWVRKKSVSEAPVWHHNKRHIVKP